MRTHTCMMAVAAFAVVTTLAAAVAEAQHPHVTPLHRDPFEMPEVYAHNRLGLDLMFGRMTVPPGDDANLLALELVGALKISRGGYLQLRLPLAYASVADVGGTALGNLGLGLEHQIASGGSGGRATTWSLGGSVSLPTASDGDSVGAASLHGLFRVPYPGRYAPDTTTLRLHTQFRFDTRVLFLQAQLGAMVQRAGGDNYTLMRFGFALGASLGRSVALIGELTTLSDVLDDEAVEDYWTTLNVGLRIRAGTHSRLGVRVYLPLDDPYRGLDIWGAGLTFTQYL